MVALALRLLICVTLAVGLWMIQTTLAHGATAESNQNKEIYFYASPQTSRYLSSVGGDYDILLNPWRKLFAKQRIAYQEIQSLDEIPLNASSVLVLPSVMALGDAERQRIISFRERGGNILTTWSFAARNANGQWTGYDFFTQLFGVTVAGEILPDSQERNLYLYGDTPLTGGYSAGQRIWLGKLPENPLRLAGKKAAASFSDWARSVVPNVANGAVMYGEHGMERSYGRWVAIGFAETAWDFQGNDVYPLMENALNWLQHRPTVMKSTWPYPYRAAQLIEMDTEEGFPNARRFADMMDTVDATATFYCLTTEAVRYPDTVKYLMSRHEISYHADVHTGFKDLPEAEQRIRLERMQAQMQSITGESQLYVGFRAPLESYDGVTEELLFSKGFRHHATDPGSTSARVPFYSPAGQASPGNALVVLPRTQRDDINLLKEGILNGGDKVSLVAALAADFDAAVAMGALSLLSIHSQNFAEGSPLALAMPDFLKHVDKYRQQVWTTSGSKIADWWRDRERLSFQMTGSPQGPTLNVTINSKGLLKSGALIITNRRANEFPKVRADTDNAVLPKVRPIDSFRTALVFDGMAPGSYSYSVVY
jgi:peptidoglycan/xylan/chitin deacetylase (PgdA/CDA1 family)